MFIMITKIECYDCFSKTSIKKCIDHNEIVFYLCSDCIEDRLEDFELKEEEE